MNLVVAHVDIMCVSEARHDGSKHSVFASNISNMIINRNVKNDDRFSKLLDFCLNKNNINITQQN